MWKTCCILFLFILASCYGGKKYSDLAGSINRIDHEVNKVMYIDIKIKKVERDSSLAQLRKEIVNFQKQRLERKLYFSTVQMAKEYELSVIQLLFFLEASRVTSDKIALATYNAQFLPLVKQYVKARSNLEYSFRKHFRGIPPRPLPMKLNSFNTLPPAPPLPPPYLYPCPSRSSNPASLSTPPT